MPATHIIYISGLGDRYDGLRRFCLRLWKYPGITTELAPMTWADSGSYDEKFARVVSAIDQVKGKRIVLFGESAGGSMAVNICDAAK